LRTATLLRPKRTGRRVAPAAGLLFEGCASLPVFKATKRPGTVLKILFKYWSAFPQVSTDHRGVLQMQALRRYGSCEEWNCAWLSRPILLRSFSRADFSVELGFSLPLRLIVRAPARIPNEIGGMVFFFLKNLDIRYRVFVSLQRSRRVWRRDPLLSSRGEKTKKFGRGLFGLHSIVSH
jgi:hypothetical protein